jgi:hypothetical protein
MTIAAPTPCTARAAINQPTLFASAHAADAAANTPKPTTNILRRPIRSPSAAAVIKNTAMLRI